MKNTGPIVIVDDDLDDHYIFSEVIEKMQLKNKIKAFTGSSDALSYLKATTDSPVIILCDINMPEMDGFELRRKINEDEALRKKSIPFVFLTTGVSKPQVLEAYNLTVQGLFLKESSFAALEHTLRLILDYWDLCKHPRNVD